ncbi:nitroreductase family protein [Baia soyae]|uniref:Nitroreductase n=1 Tax=Baia soyae TaxID=1544746 RepID=A0A4R2S3V9_9BACL|nr:nitroreductase family protein [Baia soyae]TCP70362.1 nitroreductase [Baia soyae]
MNANFQAVKEVMLSRGSVKRYDTYEMPKEELDELLILAASAPSAWNIQHWRYLAFQSEEAKQRLLPIAYNQIQVTESSVVIAILGDVEANQGARLVYDEDLKQGEITQAVYDRTLGQIDGAYQNKQYARDAAFLNASLSAMQLMLAAKAKGFDTCAMGGFNSQSLVKEFNIPDRYVPVMLITIGKAAQPARPTSRLSLDKVVLETL